MATPPSNGNGHRRRQLRARVLAEETHCALCDQPVNKAIGMTPGAHGKRCPRGTCPGCIPDPMRAEVDEDVPRSRGGSPYERDNCRLMHRACNNWKGRMTLTEARAKHAGHGTDKPQLTATTLINW